MLLQHFSAYNGNELVVDMQMIGQFNRQQNFLSQQQNEKVRRMNSSIIFLAQKNSWLKRDAQQGIPTGKKMNSSP